MVHIRLGVHTRPAVFTWTVGPTVVQIFVAEEAAPVLLTVTLPRLGAGAVDTAGIRQALVTLRALPAVITLALSWYTARPVESRASGFADSSFAGVSGPSLSTLPFPVLVTDVMSEVVVSGPTHIVALWAVVVFVAANPDGVLEAGR